MVFEPQACSPRILLELAASTQARVLMESEIRRLINVEADFKSYERIVDFRFVTKPFEVGQEMTATYKLKRHVIARQYASLIGEMFPKQHAMPRPRAGEPDRSH